MTTASPADPLGFDAFLDTDITANGRSATGAELVANAIPHRLMCETLPCIGAPNGVIEFGVDARKWIGEPFTVRPDGTSPELDAKIASVDAALQRDPRIALNQIQIKQAPESTTLADGSKAEILLFITSTLITGAVVSKVVGVSAVSVAFLASE